MVWALDCPVTETAKTNMISPERFHLQIKQQLGFFIQTVSSDLLPDCSFWNTGRLVACAGQCDCTRKEEADEIQ